MYSVWAKSKANISTVRVQYKLKALDNEKWRLKIPSQKVDSQLLLPTYQLIVMALYTKVSIWQWNQNIWQKLTLVWSKYLKNKIR